MRKLATRRVAGGQIQLAIRTKTNAAARVKLCRRNIFDDHFAIDEPFRSLAKTYDADTYSAPARVRIRKIKKTV